MLPRDYVVLATVRLPDTGEIQSVIYDFTADCVDVVEMPLEQDTRSHQGVMAPWNKERSFELIQRAPSGEWGAANVGEVHGRLTLDSELTLCVDGNPIGTLVNVAQAEQLLAMPPDVRARRLGHVAAGKGARILHDGHGLIYRIIKDKPQLRG